MAEEKTPVLDENQRRVAQKILDMSPKYQVNPDFALAVAMAESMFKDETSHKGAIGPMQLMPDTAKSLRVDPYDEDQNIEGGLRLIRQLTGHENVGFDPIRVLAGYHSGPNATFFKTNNPDDLGPNALTYIDRVATFAGGQLPSVLLTEEAANAPQDSESEVEPEGGGTVDVSEEDMLRQSADKRMQAMQALGAGAGATASTVMDTTGRVGNMVVDKAAQKAADMMAGRAPAGVLPTPPGASPGAPTPQPSAQSTRIMQGGQGDPLGTTGRARQEGYNTETARRAAVANEIKATNPQARQILANAPGMTSTPSGVLYPATEMRPTLGPRGQRTPTMAPDIGGVRPGGPSMGPSSFTPQPTAPAGALPTQKPSLGPSGDQYGPQGHGHPCLEPGPHRRSGRLRRGHRGQRRSRKVQARRHAGRWHLWSGCFGLRCCGCPSSGDKDCGWRSGIGRSHGEHDC